MGRPRLSRFVRWYLARSTKIQANKKDIRLKELQEGVACGTTATGRSLGKYVEPAGPREQSGATIGELTFRYLPRSHLEAIGVLQPRFPPRTAAATNRRRQREVEVDDDDPPAATPAPERPERRQRKADEEPDLFLDLCSELN
mmetsp:Transcript_19823/g.47328  ORF Transcript_19823/g.47328 Transcript_19823/m.47328 type:complete len:143 (+) Transcript_19823:470-898(+)